MSRKLVPKYFKIHQILAFNLKTFPEYINCYFRKILANELKICTLISENAPNLSLSREYKLSIKNGFIIELKLATH